MTPTPRQGLLWLATRHDTVGVWNQSGGSFATEYGGAWHDEEAGGEPGDGGGGSDDEDRPRNELVFIGIDMDRESLTSALDGCLLTDQEMVAGHAAWALMNDPFPLWLGGEEDGAEQGAAEETAPVEEMSLR